MFCGTKMLLGLPTGNQSSQSETCFLGARLKVASVFGCTKKLCFGTSLGMLLRWNGPARLSFSEDSLFWTKRCLDHGVAVDGTRELDIS